MADQDIRPARPDPSTSGPRATGAAGGAGPQDGDAHLPVTEVQEQIADLERQVAELQDRWRRAVADLDNLRKRYERDAAAQRARERAQVAAAWLPVVDHLELALAHATASPASIIDGVRGVRDQALAVLAGLGYPRREDVGATFDPARHEAVAATPTHAAPAGTVLEVVRPGYGEGEQQLRPAAVVVAARPENPDEANDVRPDAGAR
ncbi:nucleotide exchange factor GrpE [Blastococcus sp. KM273129]|uniref:nucleotide exchange factor GrpE n=1 Tax=Blastococcus sp. KM273129 TaxID=2570315 RepID=UPI001F36E4D4|nr:nucleotide exchange factor GrpE [Blastococcus sp. KM273129]MCF6733658.1 nucleotide exchange factor GrpE [Blastococcus sp. KM273129]